MERKKELKQLYKETPIEAGVYQIKNTKNLKIFVESTNNLKTLNGKKFMLQIGRHSDKNLQDEWNTFGKDVFIFEILEILKKKNDGYFNEKEELEKLEKQWLDHLQPYGEHGYNQEKYN